jgi:hypothetical protein
MMAQESNWETINNMGLAGAYAEASDIACLRELCAWWNDDFGACSITALAIVMTRPVVRREEAKDG